MKGKFIIYLALTLLLISLVSAVDHEDMTIIKDGEFAYLRTNYDDSRDLVQQIQVFDGEPTLDDNRPFNFYRTYLISNANLNTNGTTVLSGSTTIHYVSDDSAPTYYSASYMGANHGLSTFNVINVASHDKTNYDIGSTWTDGDGHNFTLIRVFSPTQLWFISSNLGTDEDWYISLALTGTTLSHVADATNTNNVSITSTGSDQIEPAIKNQIKKLYLSNGTEIINNGTYVSDKVNVINNYEFVNPISMVENLVARVGTSDEPDFTNGTTQITQTTNLTFDKYGGCLINMEHYFNQVVDISIDMGGLQTGPLQTGSYANTYIYSPNTLPLNISGTIWDLRTLRDFSVAPGASITPTVSYYENSSIVPYRTLRYLGTDETDLDVGQMLMFNPEKSTSQHSIRSTLTSQSYNIVTSRKTYMYAVNNLVGNIAQGTTYNFSSFRGYSRPYEYSPNADSVFFYEDGDDVYLTADYHKVCEDTITLPDEFNNRNIEVIDSNADITLNTDHLLDSTISISSSSNYSYLVLKLTLDEMAPNVTLISPEENSSYSTSSSINEDFTFSVTEDNYVDNCELFLNDVSYGINTNINQSINNTITSSDITAGSYSWYINCTDDAGNIGQSELRNLTVLDLTGEEALIESSENIRNTVFIAFGLISLFVIVGAGFLILSMFKGNFDPSLTMTLLISAIVVGIILLAGFFILGTLAGSI